MGYSKGIRGGKQEQLLWKGIKNWAESALENVVCIRRFASNNIRGRDWKKEKRRALGRHTRKGLKK